MVLGESMIGSKPMPLSMSLSRLIPAATSISSTPVIPKSEDCPFGDVDDLLPQAPSLVAAEGHILDPGNEFTNLSRLKYS